MHTTTANQTVAATRESEPNPWRTAGSRASHPSARDDAEPLIVSIARGLAEVALPWELATGHTPSDRTFELLLTTERYDAWLIHWPAGTGLEAHDHGGSGGAFAVVHGSLDEDVHDAGATRTRRWGVGEVACFDADHVHPVINRGDVGTTSVHVYSPPLSTMRFYRDGEVSRTAGTR